MYNSLPLPGEGGGEVELMRQYSTKNLPLARKLRTDQTPWENKLWSYLRAGRFFQVKFKRQVLFGPYILDFYSGEYKLGIELDGSGHADVEVKAKDAQKETYLNNLEIKVLHIWNNDIDYNIDAVLEKIRLLLHK